MCRPAMPRSPLGRQPTREGSGGLGAVGEGRPAPPAAVRRAGLAYRRNGRLSRRSRPRSRTLGSPAGAPVTGDPLLLERVRTSTPAARAAPTDSVVMCRAMSARSTGVRSVRPCSLLARVSRPSISRSWRWLTASSVAPGRRSDSSASGSSSATSTRARVIVSGVRSSWEALATNRRWLSKERSSRLSMASKVPARSLISSPGPKLSSAASSPGSATTGTPSMSPRAHRLRRRRCHRPRHLLRHLQGHEANFAARFAHIWELRDNKIIAFEQIADTAKVNEATV